MVAASSCVTGRWPLAHTRMVPDALTLIERRSLSAATSCSVTSVYDERIAFGRGGSVISIVAWGLKAVAIGVAGGLDKSPLESPLFGLGLSRSWLRSRH